MAVNIDTLSRLVNSGNSEEAYRLASETVEANEGDPKFDYLYGVAAVDSGHASEGVFALERVLMAQPSNQAARLELARGYFALGEDDRAEELFNRVQRLNPPSRVRENVQRYLDAIQARREEGKVVAVAYVEVGFGYDSNINSSPEDANFTSPLLGQGTLSEESTEQDDLFYSASVGGKLSIPLSENVSLLGKLDTNYRGNGEYDQYNSGVVTGQAGFTVKGKRSYLQLVGVGQAFYLDSEINREMLGLNADWVQDLTRHTQLTLSLQFADFEYPDQQIRNSTQTTTGLGITTRFSSRLSPVLYATGFYGHEHADDDDPFGGKAVAQREFGGVRVGGQLNLTPKFALQTSLTGQYSDYGGMQLLFLTNREDESYLFDAGFAWAPADHWTLRGSASYTRSESNIEIYEYDRVLTQLSLRRDFY
ncbi:hypothetical protein BOW53_09175 [Solemya pervernicosa gill symbiont]|uniref:Surface lipoprotein assembly modifier C-terminal domain-containing protein n=1 Tax=Solemya pervernicosa gill symbiont TaxID=642797 RepID=A0A1T2L4M4_9GAMM|nr:tetratricopeptide repeat protein [Solemya pervernicosa gill symbiont]OOZ40058.1 hypothetical protein BOW53_09175 [Solemya pervernicosa gill symbiont]